MALLTNAYARGGYDLSLFENPTIAAVLGEFGVRVIIHESLNKGLALGNDRFRKEIEHLTARRVTPLKPGPKPKLKNKEKLAKQELLL